MFEFTELTKNNIIAFRVKGKVEAGDYEKLGSHIEKLEREDRPVRLFIQVENIEGITLKALLKDVSTYLNMQGILRKWRSWAKGIITKVPGLRLLIHL